MVVAQEEGIVEVARDVDDQLTADGYQAILRLSLLEHDIHQRRHEQQHDEG